MTFPAEAKFWTDDADGDPIIPIRKYNGTDPDMVAGWIHQDGTACPEYLASPGRQWWCTTHQQSVTIPGSTLLLAQRTPYAEPWRAEDGEPADATIVLLAHPHDHQPERAFIRNDAAATESGYAVDDDDQPTGQHWYEITEFPEAPDTWATIADHNGPIFTVRICAPAGGPR